jgi:hypothetical protein
MHACSEATSYAQEYVQILEHERNASCYSVFLHFLVFNVVIGLAYKLSSASVLEDLLKLNRGSSVPMIFKARPQHESTAFVDNLQCDHKPLGLFFSLDIVTRRRPFRTHWPSSPR